MSGIRLVAFTLDAILARGRNVDELVAHHPVWSVRRDQPSKSGFTQIPGIGEGQPPWHRSAPPPDLSLRLKTIKLAPEVASSLDLLRRYGVHTALVSTTWESIVAWFAERLGVGFHAGTTLWPDDRVQLFRPEDQAPWLARLADQLDIPLVETAAVGTTEDDMEMLRLAGTGFFLGPEPTRSQTDDIVYLPRRDGLPKIAWRIVEPLREERPRLLIF